MADPIQGYAEQTEIPTRIQRPTESVPYPAVPINNPLPTQEDSSLVKTDQFNRYIPPRQMAPPQQRIMSEVGGGQDEYWVSWDTWRSRIADAVWGPLKQQGAIMWGTTRVDYDVTRDHHITITAVHTPDPTGRSAKVLVAAIMQLDGGSILTFPPGSKQTVHHNFNMDMGLPLPGKVHHTIHLRGGTEHVINQY